MYHKLFFALFIIALSVSAAYAQQPCVYSNGQEVCDDGSAPSGAASAPMPPQAPVMQPQMVPVPPVAYVQPSCGWPGHWAWTGYQYVCLYPRGPSYYGPGYYWGPYGALVFRFGGGVWNHGNGGWRGGVVGPRGGFAGGGAFRGGGGIAHGGGGHGGGHSGGGHGGGHR